MESSPLQFARDFERLKSDVARSPSPESALLRLVAFWQKLKERAASAAYRTYLEEYLQLLSSLLNDKNLTDMTIEELSVIGKFVKELPAGQIPSPYQEAVAQYRTLSAQSFARKLLYVGDYEEALAALGVANSQALAPEEADGKNETEILRALCQRAAEKASPACGFLRSVLAELEFVKDDLHQNRVNCLFVEKESDGNSTRGRLRAMEGNIRQSEADSPSHEVTFEGQIKTPDDPFVGVAYDALDALKALFQSRGDKVKAETPYHAHFSIQESGHHFTGDSIGLAFALLSYAQAVKSDVTRHERLLSGDIAVTGSIDKTGRVLPVNNETLRLKIERAFFSPVRYLVLPEENHRAAVEILKEFQTRHPRRQLRLIAAGRLGETIDDRNIIRAEKVCMGEYITRVTLRTTRRAKVQVPVLLALTYLLVCLIYPKAWIWFDWKIDHINVESQRFSVFNRSNQKLWSSPYFDKPFNANASFENYHLILNIDGDNESEILFGPPLFDHAPEIYLYDHDGKLLWKRLAYSRTDYPGDKGYGIIPEGLFYDLTGIMPFVGSGGNLLILTSALASNPARTQFICFDLAGNIVSGPYLCTGAVNFRRGVSLDFNHDGIMELVVTGINNRYQGALLAVVNPLDLNGVCPPYDNELFIMSGMQRGSQLVYVHFPETRLSEGTNVRNIVTKVYYENSRLQVVVTEGTRSVVDSGLILEGEILPRVYYNLDSNFIPRSVTFADAHFQLINLLLSKIGREPYRDELALCESLKNRVVVYHGNSVVHYPAAGIYFYSPDSTADSAEN